MTLSVEDCDLIIDRIIVYDCSPKSYLPIVEYYEYRDELKNKLKKLMFISNRHLTKEEYNYQQYIITIANMLKMKNCPQSNVMFAKEAIYKILDSWNN